MGVTQPIIGDTRLSHFSPLNQLDPASREELVRASSIEQLPPGRCLFQREDMSTRTLFLISGQLALLSDGQEARMLRADTREASAPIDPHNPRRVTALARTSVTVLSVDSELLATLLERGEKPSGSGGGSPVTPYDDEAADDRLFSAPLFARLPQPHRQVLKHRMTRIQIPAGKTLVREGEPARSYYFIERGRLRLTRRGRRRETLLMEAGPGAGVGEYGLLTSGRHDTTVSALEDSCVAGFSRGEFLTLLVRPLLHWVNYSDIAPERRAGTMILDVRPARAYQRSRLPGSINLPLRILRQVACLLDRGPAYIIYADRPGDASTAVFLLACQGIEGRLLGDAGRTERRDNPVAGARGFRSLHV